jgi:hypothetical protein
LPAIAIAKPQKAFAMAFAVMAATLAGCASGLGAPRDTTSVVGMVSRIEEGRVVDVRPGLAEGAPVSVTKASATKFSARKSNAARPAAALEGAAPDVAYMIRLRTGELVSVVQPDTFAIRKGTPVVIEYGQRARVIPQNASIGYT